ncbi:hypothetical protein D3C80_1717710 [compost metagenome]
MDQSERAVVAVRPISDIGEFGICRYLPGRRSTVDPEMLGIEPAPGALRASEIA